jgi:hypothetical protein
MRCAVVDIQPSRKAHTTFNVIAFFEARMTCQSSNRLFDSFGDLMQGLARFNPLLCPLPDLSVYFGCLTILVEEVVVHAVEMSLLFTSGSICIFIPVLDFFASRILLVCEELADWYARRIRLSIWGSLLLFLGLLLFLLLSG